MQSTSAIMNRLQADGLLKREAPLRGRVGQPTIPMSLDPEGAFSLGLKIGRRSCDLVLIDFCGGVRRTRSPYLRLSHPGDDPRFRSLLAASARRCADRSGRGAASPAWASPRRFNCGTGRLKSARRPAPWTPGATSTPRRKSPKSPPIRSRSATTRPPPARPNSSSAELGVHRDFLYFFVGAFLGGGLVLDGALRPGRTGNAGALGSMPVMAKSEGGAAPQLIACASIYQLERRLERAGIDASSMWATPGAWADFGPHLDAWIEDVASALAYASVAAISVIDFEAIVIDGAMPANVRDRVTAAHGPDFHDARPARVERRRNRLRNCRRRRARHRRRRPAADQEFRPRPGGSPQGRDRASKLTPGLAAARSIPSPPTVVLIQASRTRMTIFDKQAERRHGRALSRLIRSISSSSAAPATWPTANSIRRCFTASAANSSPTRPGSSASRAGISIAASFAPP